MPARIDYRVVAVVPSGGGTATPIGEPDENAIPFEPPKNKSAKVGDIIRGAAYGSPTIIHDVDNESAWGERKGFESVGQQLPNISKELGRASEEPPPDHLRNRDAQILGNKK
jgi:hypothetical protein